MVVEKAKVNPAIYNPQDFYPKFLTMVLRFVLKGRVRPDTSQILIYTDTLPITQKKHAKAVQVAIKQSCQREQPHLSFHVLNHRRESNAWLRWLIIVAGVSAANGSMGTRMHITF
jgi:hypothetical protein